MWNKVIFITVVLLFFKIGPVLGQELKVNKVIMVETDIAARENKILDANGNASAIIKARLVLKDIRFSSDLGIIKTEEKNGEIWLWVPPGTKKISIVTGWNDTINVNTPYPLEEYSVCIVLFTLINNNEPEIIDMPSISFVTKPPGAGIFINEMYQGISPLKFSMLPDSFSYRIILNRYYPVSGKDILSSEPRELNFRLKSQNRLYLQVNSDMILPYRRNIGFSAGIIGTTGLYFSCSLPVKNAEPEVTISSEYGNSNFDSYYLSNEGTQPYLLRHTYAVLGATRYIYGNFIVMCGIAYGRTDFYQTFKAVSFFNDIPDRQIIALREDLTKAATGFDISIAYWIKKKIVLSINNTSFISDVVIRDIFGVYERTRKGLYISDLRIGIGYSF
ncbi:MAG: hypothetical protein NT092_13280 [Bacteroidia bacterium]|nr:hypothetical protein [Bacteroidia bacterium]